MRNVREISYRKNQNTHFMLNNVDYFFRKLCRSGNNVEKYCSAGPCGFHDVSCFVRVSHLMCVGGWPPLRRVARERSVWNDDVRECAWSLQLSQRWPNGPEDYVASLRIHAQNHCSVSGYTDIRGEQICSDNTLAQGLVNLFNQKQVRIYTHENWLVKLKFCSTLKYFTTMWQ